MAKIPVEKKEERERKKNIRKKEKDLKMLDKKYDKLNKSALAILIRKDSIPDKLKTKIDETIGEIKEVEDELDTLR